MLRVRSSHVPKKASNKSKKIGSGRTKLEQLVQSTVVPIDGNRHFVATVARCAAHKFVMSLQQSKKFHFTLILSALKTGTEQLQPKCIYGAFRVNTAQLFRITQHI